MSDEPKWYASGRGIFCRDAGFQLATMPVSVNWQEDTARLVDLLNKGEAYESLERELAFIKLERDKEAAAHHVELSEAEETLTRSEARCKEQDELLLDARKWIEDAAHEIECMPDEDGHEDGCPAAHRHGIVHRIDAAIAPDGTSGKGSASPTLSTLYVITRGGETLATADGRPRAYHTRSVAERDAAEWPSAEVIPYRPALAPDGDDRESAWCIEAPGPLFWNGGRCDGFGVIGDAVRFARKEDAEMVLAGVLCRRDNLIVTGHTWIALAPEGDDKP